MSTRSPRGCAVHRNEPYFKTLKSIENICEDIRIEHHLFRKYPGTRLDIDAALEMVMLGEGEPATDYWPAVVNWLLLRFRSRLLRQTLLDDVAGVSDAILSSMVDRSVLDEADKLGETILAFGPTKSDHARVFALADQLFDLFDRNKPSSQPDPEPESKPEPEKERRTTRASCRMAINPKRLPRKARPKLARPVTVRPTLRERHSPVIALVRLLETARARAHRLRWTRAISTAFSVIPLPISWPPWTQASRCRFPREPVPDWKLVPTRSRTSGRGSQPPGPFPDG